MFVISCLCRPLRCTAAIDKSGSITQDYIDCSQSRDLTDNELAVFTSGIYDDEVPSGSRDLLEA